MRLRRRNVEYKILGLEEALKVAEILSPHIDLDSIDGVRIAEVITATIASMEEPKIIELASLLILGDFVEEDPIQIIETCGEALINNDFISLVYIYRQLGFA
jgi:hypothetical protein